ncbi:metallophosphoesterase, partial [Stenotrophomonas maltophilia]|uniref:metallophosphoesterase n=1 Tax=Stenotrophomonas maltophilia TaxID=40324 RepID=UPI001954B7D6
LGPHLFTFAIVTDTHCTEGDGASSSPWPSNKHANARARHVFERIRQAAPQFVLHLGDMVHPVPAQPTFAAAAAKY